MNIFSPSFTATCPNNGQTIAYRLEIEAHHVIMVEDIAEECSTACDFGKPYHDTIADYLHARLGGRQRMAAFYHGTEIETRRG